MIINRVWAMPNKWTFKIKPIKELLDRFIENGWDWIDPFAGMYSPAQYTNDLNPKCNAESHCDAPDYIKKFRANSMNGAIYDPPYSLRQIMECYKGFGLTVDKLYATTKFYTDVKNLLAQKVKIGGYVICCGWNSIGLGKKRGFKLIEVLLVCHGRLHNDTIVTVEQKIHSQEWLI